MNKTAYQKDSSAPDLSIEHAKEELSLSDLNDLCDATDSAIEGGGGFGWVSLPARDTLERFWQGMITMPKRDVFLARLDDVICGTCVLVHSPNHNEAQAHSMSLTSHFVAPWARGHGLARMLLHRAEKQVLAQKCSVINLDVRETQEAAIRLYQSESYDHYATHPAYAYVSGHYVAGYYFMKILDA